MVENKQEYDIFLSHASDDKTWVRQLEAELTRQGLTVFLDELCINPGDNWVLKLSDGLKNSRYMVLILSNHTEGRHWVEQEWTNWLADKSALQRLLPVKIDTVKAPFILNATQAINALDRDAEVAALHILRTVGDPSKLSASDTRRLILGRDLVATVSMQGDNLQIHTSYSEPCTCPLPWKSDAGFGVSYMEFSNLQKQAITRDTDRADLTRHAKKLGKTLFNLLFDEDAAERLEKLIDRGHPRPVLRLLSDDAFLHALPWELLCHNDNFLIRDGKIDLIRSTTKDVDNATLLTEPHEPFKLVVNVSAPENSGLSYEEESYRITLAIEGRCEMVPTELGTLNDLVETVVEENPTGIHFSGHGSPGALHFENNVGRDHEVPVAEMVQRLQTEIPNDRPLPPFFYFASCHSNDPVSLNSNNPDSQSAAMQLHQAGVTQVVGYDGPILDELSTRAEETLYEAIAKGYNTRDAIRLARQQLARPFYETNGRHRPSLSRSPSGQTATPTPDPDTHPFAWAQLVFYHRGADWPLSPETKPEKRRRSKVLKRTYDTPGRRQILKTGFIGRRNEQHKIRKRLEQGDRVFVFQGLGGLGKSTLSQYILPWLSNNENEICTLWCQEVEKEDNKAEALVSQLLAFCRARFKLDWEGVVQQVDKIAGDQSDARFLFYLQALLQNMDVVLYLDNLESLLIGPEDDNAEALGSWAEPTLQNIWQGMQQLAENSDKLYLIASCRYRNPDFEQALMPVSPLPQDALFRLTDWFPALQKLSPYARANLVNRLDGHPRAVEYTNDLIMNQLTQWRNHNGDWSMPAQPTEEDLNREWNELVKPALPEVTEKLKDNLLLNAIWSNVLNNKARRFLYRMTILRTPVEWSILCLMGDPEMSEEEAIAIATRLKNTSLLEQTNEILLSEAGETVIHYAIHPATVSFIFQAHDEEQHILLECHRRLGDILEARANENNELHIVFLAGHHLFQGEQYDRSYTLLGPASDWLRQWGRVREALNLLVPFLQKQVETALKQNLKGRMLGTVGRAYASLGEVAKAMDYYEQALEISREIGDRHGEGTHLGNLGLAYADLGEVVKAVGYYEQALEISREIGDRSGEGADLGNLGRAYADLGEVAKAVDYYELALEISREIGDRRGEGNHLNNLGLAYRSLGEVAKAVGYYEQALEISRETGDRHGEGNSLGNLGNAYADLGEVAKAVRYYKQALEISRETGDRHGEGNSLGNLGLAYADLGEVAKAVGYYEQALEISREIGDRRGDGANLGNLGIAYASLGEVAKAVGYYEQALEISREIGDRRGEGNHLGNLGLAYADLGEIAKAVGYYEQALEISREIGYRRGEGNHLGNLGHAYASLGEVAKAVGYYEQALQIGLDIQDPRIVEAIKPNLAKLQGNDVSP